MEHVRTGHAAGLLSAQIAEQLQQAGYRTINPELPWDKHVVLALLRRSELLPGRIEKIELTPDEWLLADLARHLDIGCSHLRRWMHRKGVHGGDHLCMPTTSSGPTSTSKRGCGNCKRFSTPIR